MALSLTQAAIDLIDQAGYAGLAGGLFLNAAGVPIPSEILIPLGAAAAREGGLSLVSVVVVSIIAQIAGGVFAYELGRREGVPLVRRYGKFLLISEHEMARVHRQFERHGQVLALVGACIPVIRGYVGYAAGIAEMPRAKFWAAISLGYLIWTAVLAYAGWQLGSRAEEIDHILKPFSYLIIVFVILAAIFYIRRRIRETRGH